MTHLPTYLAFADATTAPTAAAPQTVTATPGTARPAATTKPVPPPGWVTFLQNPIPIILIVVVVMMMFSGQGKRRSDERQRQDMLKALKRGDKVQTIGGIQGTVVSVEEKRVSVKVDETKDTKMWFARTAIAQVLVDGDGKVVDAK